MNLGGVYRLLGRLDEAVRHHEQALLVARELKAQTREADVLSQLARDERDRGNLARARTHIEGSLAIAESLRSSDEIASPEKPRRFPLNRSKLLSALHRPADAPAPG